jgi:branched-chain amino acid aminotransferase
LSKIGQIQVLVQSGLYYLTEHADDEAIADSFDIYDVEQGILTGKIRRTWPNLAKREDIMKGKSDMSLLIYLNGKLVPKEKAKISIYDHGLLYGVGFFEGIRVYGGRVFRLAEHFERLCSSAKAIDLNIPLDTDELTQAVLETLRANKLKDAYIRLVVTRGVGDLGLDPEKCSSPTLFIIADDIELYPEELYRNGMEVITVVTRRNIAEALNPRIKSLNYLNNILAKIEANLSSAPEAIMLNSNGYVAECTGDNIFMVKDGRLLTPPVYAGALEGVTRNVVLELAKSLEIETSEPLLTRYDLYTADEAFLTGTAAEIIAVVKVDGRAIGDGRPGKITRQLTNEFRKLTKNEGTEIYPET